jgi:hypothetical protein
VIARRLGLFGVVALLALAGCSEFGSPPSGPTAADQSWERVVLPDGFTGSQLLVVDGHLVVGGSQGDAPTILVGADGDPLAPIPVGSTTFYGDIARWYAISADGSDLRALGGRAGGGHGNPRWSTWVGDLDQLDEVGTPGIEIFGGWRGGGMVGVTVVDGQAVIVGGRAGDGPGLDIAVWLERDGAWVEQPSTGTTLGATDAVLPFPSSVVPGASGLLITGFTQRIGGGEVRDVANAWTGAPTGPWERIELPNEAEGSTADAASCDTDGCVIVGRGDDRVLAWSYADREVAPLALPDLVSPDEVPAPVTWDGRATIVAPGFVAVSADLAGWDLLTGPEGAPLAAAPSGDVLYVLVTMPDGAVELWRTA